MDWALALMVRLGISGSELQRFQKKKTYTAAVSFLLKERKKKGLFPQILIYLKKKKHSGII
jgi:hypothetical protein